jgi:hypothetical protein
MGGSVMPQAKFLKHVETKDETVERETETTERETEKIESPRPDEGANDGEENDAE